MKFQNWSNPSKRSEAERASKARPKSWRKRLRASRLHKLEVLEDRRLLAAVITGQPSYEPGQTVEISATGFSLGEAVEFQVKHIDGTPNSGHGHEPWQVIDGSTNDLDGLADGNIESTWYVHEDDGLGSTFGLDARGLTSGKATWTSFTDAIPTPLVRNLDISRPLFNPFGQLYHDVSVEAHDLPLGARVEFEGWVSIEPTIWSPWEAPRLDFIRVGTATDGGPLDLDGSVNGTVISTFPVFNLPLQEGDHPAFATYGHTTISSIGGPNPVGTRIGITNDLSKPIWNGPFPSDTASAFLALDLAPLPVGDLLGMYYRDASGSPVLLLTIFGAAPYFTHGFELPPEALHENARLWLGRIGSPNFPADWIGRARLYTNSPPRISLSGSSGNVTSSSSPAFSWSISDRDYNLRAASVKVTKDGIEKYSRSYASDVSNQSLALGQFGFGSYVISVTATDVAGVETFASQTVNVVNSPPTAVFDVTTPADGRIEGSAIVFDATGSGDFDGPLANYVWNFGDGSLATGTNPSHAYADNGTYDVRLTVVDSLGDVDTTTQTITVGNVAPSTTASSPASVNEAAPFELTVSTPADPGRDTTTVLVDWGDGATETFASGGVLRHVYRDGGVRRTVRVSLSDEDGSYPDRYVSYVDVLDAAPVVSLPPFFTAQGGEPIFFTAAAVDSPSDTLSYAWAFGDGMAQSGVNLNSVSHAYASDGVYPVALTVTDSDGLSAIVMAQVVVGTPASFTTGSQMVGEGESVTVTVLLDNGTALGHDVVVPIVVSGGPADYSLSASQIVIPAGMLSGSVTLGAREDLLAEDDEELVVRMGLPTGASHGTVAEQRVTVLDNDAKPTVFFTTRSQSVDEGSGTLLLTAGLSAISGRDVVVPVSFSGTALAGEDYSLPDGHEIVIAAGSLSGSLDLRLTDDSHMEGAETILISMLPSGQAELSNDVARPTSASLLIPQNDAPVVSLDSAYRLTAEGAPAIHVRARLSRISEERITVPFTISGTASNGLDYEIAASSLAFAPGSDEASVTVTVTDDQLVEGTENILIQLTAPPNAVLGTSQTVLTDILDNDIVRVSFEAGDVAEWEGGVVPVKVKLSNASTRPVTVPIIVSGTATTDSDFTLSTVQLVLAAGVTEGVVSVTLMDDAANETPEWLYLSFGTIVGGVAGEHTAKAITIKDDDPLVSFVQTTGSIVEGDGSIRRTIQLSSATSHDVTVPLRFSGTARRGMDYDGPLSVTIPKGSTSAEFTLSITDDSAVEPAETIAIALGAPDGGVLGQPKSVSLTLRDNDHPSVYWGSRFYSVDEATGAAVLTVGLSQAALQDVTVRLAYSSEASTINYKSEILGRAYRFSVPTEVAESGRDYQQVGTVVIPKGHTSASIAVPVIDDVLAESPEIIGISFVDVSNAVLPSDTSLRKASLTITDRDVMTEAEYQSTMARLAQSTTQEVVGFDIAHELSDFANNETNQEDILDTILYAAERAAAILPIPGGLVTRAAIHAVAWTQEQYPLGFGLDTEKLGYDMSYSTERYTDESDRRRGDGAYFEYLGSEMAVWLATEGMGALISGYFTGPQINAFLKEAGHATVEAVSDYYNDNKEKVSDTVTDFVKANDDDWIELKEDPGGTIQGGIDYYFGFVSGGTVFFDVNFDGVQSPLDPIATTAADGRAYVSGLGRADVNGNGSLDLDEGQWVGVGGLDTSVNQPTRIPIAAPAGYSKITPTSALIAAMMSGGSFTRTPAGLKAAEARLLQAVGLPEVELAHLDFLRSAAAGDAVSAALFAEETQYYNAVIVLATLFEARGAGLPLDRLAGLVFEDLADKISAPGSSLNLANAAVVSAVITGLSIRSGIAVDAATAAAVADALARSNRLVDLDIPQGSRTFLDRVVRAHKFVQSDLAAEVARLGRGELSVTAFNTANADIAARVAAARAYDVLPIYLLVEDAVATEGSGDAPTVVTFTVTPTGSSAFPVSVAYRTDDRSATAGIDYDSTTGLLEWDAGDSTSRKITVTVNADVLLEPDEAFALLFSDPQNATLLVDQVHGRILNDDIYSYKSAADVDDDLAVSVLGTSLIVSRGDEILYDGRFEAGGRIELFGQATDGLTLFASAATQLTQTIGLDGSRTVQIGNHTIVINGIGQLSEELRLNIDGIPAYLFDGTPVALTIAPPTSFNPATTIYNWTAGDSGNSSKAVIGNGANIEYLPDQDHQAVEVTLTDGVRTFTVRREVIVYPPNVAPVAVDDFATATENTSISVDVITNDTDLNPEDILSLVPSSVAVASMTIDRDGSAIIGSTSSITPSGNSVVFDPSSDFDVLAAGETATVVIDYTVTDDDIVALTNDGQLVITITGTNDAPIVDTADVTGAVTELVMPTGDLTDVGVLAFSDVDLTDAHAIDGAIKASADALGSLTASVTLDTTGTGGGGAIAWNYSVPATAVEYLAQNESKLETFIITLNDGNGGTVDRLISVTITGTNDKPTATDNAYITTEETAISGNVMSDDTGAGEDSDPDASDTLTASLVNGPANGSLLLDDDGSFTYTPDVDFDGIDSFEYQSEDGRGGFDTAVVTMHVLNLVDVSGRVYVDFDNNGRFDAYDQPLEGVSVKVFHQADDIATASPIASVQSASDGKYYLNANLVAGAYKIVEVVDEFAELGLLDGRETPGNLGGVVRNGQDSNEIALSAGEPGTDADAVDYLFAEIEPADIFGTVWRDFNNDGEINFGEAGIDGAIVQLTGSDDRGTPVALTATTGTDGGYAHIHLRPGTYELVEMQPAGFDDGKESLGEVTDSYRVATPGVDSGFIDGNDIFSGIVLVPGSEGDLYNFGERSQPGESIGDNVTAGIGFWHNKNGEALIESLNGGAHSTQLGNWLAATFPDMYGAGAYYDASHGGDQAMDLTNKSNAYVADVFQFLHKRNTKTAVAGGPPKVEAQVMALALAAYVTSEQLACGAVAASYGFNTSADGIAYTTFNVLDVMSVQEADDLGLTPLMDASGNVTIMDLLQATNAMATKGLLYDADGSNSIDSFESLLRTLASDLYTAINETTSSRMLV